MTTVERILKKLNVEYKKTWSNWEISYETTTSIIVEKVNLKNKSTMFESQQTLTDSVHINGLYTPNTAIEDVIEFLHISHLER